uniref:Apyrase n=1 Tax=Erythrolobus australicus TaxID=1077150 RepID=A0A7S1TM44_9RHOD
MTRGVMARRPVLFVALLAAATLAGLGLFFQTTGQVQFGLMIDAGSTGSRMHTFKFLRRNGKMELLNEDFLPIKPGLSSYKDEPEKAGASLRPLLERSKNLVPPHLRASTPVYLRATAGLRMTGEETAEKILASARRELKSSGFMVRDKWVSILGGNDEGIYSWITVNYLLSKQATSTVGTLEMGGGSAQIAFVPSALSDAASVGKSGSPAGCEEPPAEVVEFMGENLRLYTTSHLGYGIKKAKATMMEHFKDAGLADANPCLSRGPQKVTVPFSSGEPLAMTGAGDFTACELEIDRIMGKDAGVCKCGVCTYGAKGQPHAIKEYVAIAFYVERTVDIGMKSPISLRELRAKGKEVCAMDVDEVAQKYPNVPNGAGTDLCFDLSFIHSHLHLGNGIPQDDDSVLIHVVNKINGVELGWSLGAMFHELSLLDRERGKA